MNFDQNILPKSVNCSFDILDNVFLTPGERKQNNVKKGDNEEKEFYYFIKNKRTLFY